MKKSMLYTGIAYCAAGLCCLAAGLLTETWFDGMFWGLFGGLTAPGLMMLWKYFYWTRPENREEYARRLVYALFPLCGDRPGDSAGISVELRDSGV